MKTISLFTLIALLVSCGKETGGNDATSQESESLSISREEEMLGEKLLKKKDWKQSELLKAIVLSPGTKKFTMRRLDRIITINCNGTTGNCSLTPKDVP